jgi:hypothetical protein
VCFCAGILVFGHFNQPDPVGDLGVLLAHIGVVRPRPPPAFGGGCHFAHIDGRGGAFPQRFPATGADRCGAGVELRLNESGYCTPRILGKHLTNGNGDVIVAGVFLFLFFFFP